MQLSHQQKRIAIVVGAPVLSAFLSAVLISCGTDEGETEKSDPESAAAPISKREAQFVGAQNCKGCHEQAYDDWTKSDHFMAMQPANTDTVLGNFDDVTFEHFGRESKFFKKDGKFFVNTEDGEGVRRDFEITHTFGFEPLQQYLIPFPGGRLQALQICWDSRPEEEGGQRWYHLYPDEEIPPDDALHWTGQHFNWNFMCADCHSTKLEKNFDFTSLSYNTTWSEMNVSCEACHGPGSEHVAWARESDESAKASYSGHLGLDVRYSESEPGAWIIDAETGQPKRTRQHDGAPAQLDTCARCHAHRQLLQPNFKAGHPFHDTHRPSTLTDVLYYQDGQIKEEVYVYGSFAQSKMHHAGVRCTDCHQPHTMKPLAEGNALCVRCHVPDRYDSPAHHFHEAKSEGASCVECHMPHTTYMVVDDRRDHSIRIPRPDLSDKLGTPNACNRCHTDKTNQWAADAITAWRAGRPAAGKKTHPGELFHAARNGEPGSDAALARLARDPSTNGIYRATAISILGSIPTPTAAAAVFAGRYDPDPAARTAALSAFESLEQNQRIEGALPLLRDPSRSVRIAAASTLAPFRNSLSGADAKAFDSAAREYLNAQAAILDRAGGHFNIARFYTDLGDPARAEASYRNGLKVDPADIPCAVNLADLLWDLDRAKEGLPLLLNVTEKHPDNPLGWRALSTYYVRAGQREDALATLAKAVEAAPGDPDILYYHGLALHEAGRTEEALASLRKTHSIQPTNAAFLEALATISRDAGNWDDAFVYAKKWYLYNPANAQQLLDQLEELRK